MNPLPARFIGWPKYRVAARINPFLRYEVREMFGKWSSTTKIINGGNKVNIAHTKLSGALSKSEQTTAAEVVATSRAYVANAANLVRAAEWSDAAKAAAAACFLTPAGGPDNATKTLIQKVLTMTNAGIAGQTTIKVGSSVGANGYVNIHKDLLHKFTSKKVTNLQTNKSEYIGGAHVDRAYIDKTTEDRPRAILTFIHEATHRYAGTVDFDDKGYISATNYFAGNGIMFRQPGLTAAEAVINADSYAVFIYQLHP